MTEKQKQSTFEELKRLATMNNKAVKNRKMHKTEFTVYKEYTAFSMLHGFERALYFAGVDSLIVWDKENGLVTRVAVCELSYDFAEV